MARRVHHLDCCPMRPLTERLVHGAGSLFRRGRLVAHVVVIETDAGLVLVDSGIGLADIAEPAKRLGRGFLSAAGPLLDPERTALRQLEALGYRPSDVRHIVLTHLDLDHAGGIGDFPTATIHVLATEHAAAMARVTRGERERYRVIDGDGAAEVGQYGLEVTVDEELAAGDACSPGDPLHHCPPGSHCSGAAGKEKCAKPLLIEEFTTGLGALTVVDVGNDMETWYACVPPGCSEINYTPSKSQGGFAMVFDEPDVPLDGEALVTPELDATALASVRLEFDHDYYDYARCAEKIAVQYSLDGTAWTDVMSWTHSVSAHEKLDLSAQVAGKKFRIRFVYDDDTVQTDCYAWDWRIDDVLIY